MVTGTTMDGNMEGTMSAELVAIIAAAVSLGGLVLARTTTIDARLRSVESDLSFLNGLIQGAGLPAHHDPDQNGHAA